MTTRLPPNERLILSTRPGFLFVLFYRQGWWLIPPLILFVLRSASAKVVGPDSRITTTLPLLALAWLLIGLLLRVIAWLCRSYTLTDRRLFVAKGVLSRAYAEVPLARIQHTTMTQSILERAFHLGTIGISTADGNAINWLMTPRPHQVLAAIREATEQAPPPAPAPRPRVAPAAPGAPGARPAAPRALHTIGLAGGIGSGKSEVARILSSLGCTVIDSDAEAKEALDRPEVRSQLLQWWGPSVVDTEGRVNRKAIADIIFKDPDQRTRLEALIHPLVRARRIQVRRDAVAAGAPAIVIDAPLLFEAGLDSECDAILFVDAPRETRLARVRATRSWDEAELARRETSQLSLDEKRRRSTHVIPNTGDTRALAASVQNAFKTILSSPPKTADT